MKKLSISLFLFSIIQNVTSQDWVALGSNDQASNSITVTAALTFFTQVSNDGVPYISYIDDATGDNNLGDFKVHARRFNNGQWEFAGDGISPSFPGSDDFPVALDGNVPYVAYVEPFTPVNLQTKLTVRRLNSNTGGWEVVGQQGLSDGVAAGAAITADNGKIYVAYADGALDSKITVKLYDNNNPANGWQTVGTTGFSNGFVLGINIAIDNGIPYVAYRDFTDNAVFVKKFNGTTWEDVGANSPSAGQPAAVRSLKFNSGHTPYIAFVDSTGAGIVRNLNTENAWVTTGNQAVVANAESIISLAILNDIPFVATGIKQNGISQASVKRFDAANNSWPNAGNQPVTASTSLVNNIALTTAGNNKLLLVYRNLNGQIYAKTFDAGGVLPVSLTTFYITPQNSKSLLQWATASEQDTRLFEIEHSADAATFQKIGEVTAKVPADVQQRYSFVHASPANGINYYRLKQVDKNGDYTYSKIISIAFNHGQEPVITLSPNPVKDVLHGANLGDGEKEITITNTEGKIVKRLKATGKSIDINVAGLPAGTYFMSIYGDKVIKTKTFIK